MKRRSILLIFVALAGNAAGDVFVDKHALPGEGSSNIQTTLDEMRKAQHVPGIGAVVIHDNEVIFAGGSGVADIETGRPVTADTLFYIGSVTKVLTATLALHLVESEALSLDDVVDGIANQSSGEPPQISVTHPAIWIAPAWG